MTQVRENAEQSHSLSKDSRQEARKGMVAVNETIGAMGEIAESFDQLEGSVTRLAERSRSIDDIIQVISDVAEQTSMLALNASIIAAQSGEHGKPFAVVAEQVKNLAQRTHRSTQEISELIHAVQEDTAAAVKNGSSRVERGVERSSGLSAVLRKIIDKSEVSTERVREIAEAAAHQSSDLARVDQAMLEVKEIVEQIGGSTREQLRATTEIAEAVQKIRALSEDVKRSGQEQRQGSKLITNSVMLMSDRVGQIAEATKAQTASSEAIHETLKGFSEFTDETDRRAEALREIVSTLSDRSRQLEREIGRFVTE